MVATAAVPLSPRWTPLRFHATQARLWNSRARFKVIEAGRRSGKTELAKRRGCISAAVPRALEPRYRIAFCGPTRDQARAIFWEDVKSLSRHLWSQTPSESRLEIVTTTGCRIQVVGLDKPQRVEGDPLDEAYIDEIAEMKPGVWDRNIRPALSTDGRPGSAWLFGVPRPSPQFAELAEIARDPEHPEWEYFHWTAEGVVPAAEIESARATMDPLFYEQEYLASRVSFSGRCYYPFTRDRHVRPVGYMPGRPLIFAFDFNVDPGSCCVLQEQQQHRDYRIDGVEERFTAQLGEVNILRNSTTASVCRKLVADWGRHRGDVHIHGDPAGGARSTQASEPGQGDWSIVEEELRRAFVGRLRFRYARKAPLQKDRVNAMNARLMAADGSVRFAIHPSCKATIRDFESVVWNEGTDFEIDKDDDALTHWTDGVGYYVHEEFAGSSVGAVLQGAF